MISLTVKIVIDVKSSHILFSDDTNSKRSNIPTLTDKELKLHGVLQPGKGVIMSESEIASKKCETSS